MPGSGDLAVEVDSLAKSFGSVRALTDISFSARKGTVLGVLGPNGAGKTTTIKCLSTLLRADSGTARVAGYDVATQGAQVRRSIMMTGQFAALDGQMTAAQNLAFFGRLMGLNRKQARARANELLDTFGLTEAADRKVATYSGGMRRRVDLACGLVVRPDVVFLDEPTTGLDPRSRLAVWQVVRTLRDEGITTLLTTQYLEEVDALSDHIVVIDHGQVIASGTADDLKDLAGGTFLVIDFRSVADREQAVGVLSSLTPAGQSPLDNENPAQLAISAPQGPETLSRAVRLLDDAQLRVSDIGLRRPTLDDVFLKITGHAGGK